VKYLLDTCTVSDYFRRTGGVAEALHARPPHELGISSITEHEIQFGLARQKRAAPTLQSKVRAFLSVVRVVAFDSAAAQSSAQLRAQAERSGHSIGVLDTLIAGVAMAHSLVLVTSNTRELSRVDGLELVNWR